MNWYSENTAKIYESLKSSPQGLSDNEADFRLKHSGLNELYQHTGNSAWQILVHQFSDFMILILLGAAVISGIIGDLSDTIVILFIVLVNAVIGFSQEYRAEKALVALRQMADPVAVVIRDGKSKQIPGKLIVPGDIINLEAGRAVPADLRIIESNSLQADESSLTGESLPVYKHQEILPPDTIPVADQCNMLFKGTTITYGRGKGMVVATGMQTELGKIARMLQQKEPPTPLQVRLADFGKKLSYIILLICVLLFFVGIIRGENSINMLLVVISVAVAAIPEALPTIITIALALGAKRLIKRNVLIRKLQAVETLGSITYICSDKTGTITQNKMVVEDVVEGTEIEYNYFPGSTLNISITLNHDVEFTAEGETIGDPTELALVDYILKKVGIQEYKEILNKFPRIAEIPFDSNRKCMSTIHRFQNKYLLITKGAPESIFEKLEHSYDVAAIQKHFNALAGNGMRVLAYAFKWLHEYTETTSHSLLENNLHFAGMTGMKDPPKPGVKNSILECREAGIIPVMITGDHPQTAKAIAMEVGISDETSEVITGKELNLLTSDELDEKVEKTRIFARVSPEQKLLILQSLQRRNHFVAMTGDGVNDAPALKSANIGVSMGIHGTDVSKEAAHMILLDDNFSSIVKAVKEGRRIFDNIRNFIKYIMTCNSAEIWTIFLAPLVGLPIPLLPIHILWINLVTDGLPGLALANEKADPKIMNRPPRPVNQSLFAEGIGYHILWVGILMAMVTLGIQAWAIQDGNSHWQTMVFTVLSLAQLGHVFAIRSSRQMIYKAGIFSNRALLLAVLFTFLLQLGTIYLPFANKIFHTTPLSIYELMICIIAASLIFHAVEFEKWVKFKRASVN